MKIFPRIISIFVTILITFSLVSTVSTAFAYRDVETSNPYFSAIQFFESKKIVPSKLFFPKKAMQRGEFIRWLLETEDFDEKNYKKTSSKKFSDVPEKLGPYVSYLIDSGAFEKRNFDAATEAKLLPEEKITLGEMLDLTFFIKGIPAPKIFPEKDWPFTYVRPTIASAHILFKASQLNLLPPGKKIFPWLSLTREEAAHLLSQAEESESGGTLVITVGGFGQSDHEITQNPKFQLLTNIWDRITKTYLHRDKVKNDELVYGAISGLVKELRDQYTQFSRPEEGNVGDTLSGEIEGIGAHVESDKEGRIRVVAPLKNSPAEIADVLPGDIILAVNGEEVTGLPLNTAVEKIRGPAGTTVILKIQRNGKTFEVSVIRAKIIIPTVILEFTSDNIAILTITTFGNNVMREFIAAKDELVAKGTRGLIIDLRNDPGGFLDAATSIASYFVESGKNIAVVRYPDHEEKQISAGTAELASLPLRIVVNRGSASASEILAGALQDHSIGKIVGEKTYGKGTVQEFTTYTDGSAFKVTVAEWLMPNGRSIEGIGITPDIVVARTEADILGDRDPQMEEALAGLRKEIK